MPIPGDPVSIKAMDNHEFFERLRTLIGRRCAMADGEWQIIDVLEAEDAVVIQRLSGGMAPIQTNAFGSPSRRAPDIRLVPLSAEHGRFTPAAEALLRNLQPRD